MTNNQILYWTLQETKRSNKAKEREERRSNKAAERETARSHRANEAYNSGYLGELMRSHQASEGIDLSRLAEQQRSNQAQEALSAQDLSIKADAQHETSRHNQQSELYDSMNSWTQKEKNDLQKQYNDAKLRIDKQEADARTKLSSSEYDYYQSQVDKIENDIDRLWQQFDTDKTLGTFNLIEKYIKDLVNLLPTVINAKG
nr:putative ORF1 [Marmot picobirnavirus]